MDDIKTGNKKFVIVAKCSYLENPKAINIASLKKL